MVTRRSSSNSRFVKADNNPNVPVVGASSVGKTLPHNLEAESGLLACLIMDGGADVMADCLSQHLTAEAFFHPNHQIIFEALLGLYQENKPADLVLLAEKLKSMGKLEEVGGAAALGDLTQLIETTTHAGHWLQVVRDSYLLRKLIRTTTSVAERAYTYDGELPTFIDEVEQTMFAISEDRLSDSAKPIKESVAVAVGQVQQMIQNRGSIQGICTGFTDINKMTFGLHPQEMIVVAARPSVGKTSFALNIAENAVLPHHGREATPTLVFSLEMGADQLAMRMLCSQARVRMGRLRDGFIDKNEQQALAQAAQAIQQAPLWIDDSGYQTILELRAKARRMHARHKIGLIIIDYLQLIAGTDPRVQREQQISEISRGIKAIAKELKIPVIVLSQLNRESEREKRKPRISDLRESGAIEQDADVVMLLHRPVDDSEGVTEDNQREIIVAKQRNGPIGSVPLTFIPDLTRFENFTQEAEPV
jgi:replicative DNA helicase